MTRVGAGGKVSDDFKAKAFKQATVDCYMYLFAHSARESLSDYDRDRRHRSHKKVDDSSC